MLPAFFLAIYSASQLPVVCVRALRYCHVAARKKDQILPGKLKFMQCKLRTYETRHKFP